MLTSLSMGSFTVTMINLSWQRWQEIISKLQLASTAEPFPVNDSCKAVLWYFRQGHNHGWKVERAKAWVPTPGSGRVSSPLAVGSGMLHPEFLKTRMLNSAFWWLLRSLVRSLGRVYTSNQQACKELNQFQNYNFSAVVAPLAVRTKKQWKLWNNTCFEISCFF